MDGKKLRRLRLKKGLSYREAAAYILGRTGVSVHATTLQHLESNADLVARPETVAAIASAYDVGVSDLVPS